VSDVVELAAEYRHLAWEWGQRDLHDPTGQNALHERLHAVQKELASSSPGRAAIVNLMGDADPYVRGWAAAHSLRWSERKARAVLEDLRDHDSGIAGFDAKHVLREHDAGRLTFDY
jgi:hypothetical protein